MVGIVETDTDELADPPHARPEAKIALRVARHEGQRADVDSGNSGQARRGQRLARNVGHDAGQVANASRCVQQARLFLALGAVAQKFHLDVLSLSVRERSRQSYSTAAILGSLMLLLSYQ